MMSQGHGILGFLVGLWSTPMWIYWKGWTDGFWFFLGQILAITMFSPDLDLKFSKSRQAWGILGFLWIGYPRLFRHRGLSHWPFLGTITRWLYLHGVFLLLIFFGFLGFELYQGKAGSQAANTAWLQIDIWQRFWIKFICERPEVTSLAAGFFWADLWHLLGDLVWSLFSRRKSSKIRKPLGRQAS